MLLVSFDTTRFDHTSLAGYARDTTPHMSALAAEGTSFGRAYAPASTTGPSHASLFTGLSPLRHGVVKNGMPLPTAAVTLAERLQEAGYATAAFVSSFVISQRFSFDQGFAEFDDAFDPESSAHREFWEGHKVEGGFDRRADETTRRAVRWLEENAERDSFFLFVHYFDPHGPYRAPEGFSGRFEVSSAAGALAHKIARYDEEIAFTDAQLGELLAALERLGLSSRTAVVVLADHGEGLMDHGYLEHGVQIFEEQVRVPLVMRWPSRITAGLRIEDPVELVDVTPTLLELLGLPRAPLEGRSLAGALLSGERLDPDRPVHLYRRYFRHERRGDVVVKGEKFGVVRGRFKYIEGPEEGTRELYDLEADPKEERNCIDLHPDVVQELAVLVAAWRGARAGPEDAPLDLAPEDRSQLEALGYTE